MSAQIYDRLPKVNKRHTNAAALNTIMYKKLRGTPGRNQLLDLNKLIKTLLILGLVSWVEFKFACIYLRKNM